MADLLTADDVLQSNSGSFNAASGSATLGVGTTAGTTVILIVGTGSLTLSPDPPTGFVRAGPVPGSNRAHIFRRSNVPAGETSWTIGLSAAGLCAWAVFEVADLDLIVPVLAAPASFATATATQLATGSVSVRAVNWIGFAVHLAVNSANATPPTWSGHTNLGTSSPTDLAEVIEQGAVGASTSLGMSVSRILGSGGGSFDIRATSTASLPLGATFVAFAAAGATMTADITAMFGFEQGTLTGLTGAPPPGVITTRYLTATAGSPTLTQTNPRTGGWCLELSATAAAENLNFSEVIVGTTTLVTRVSVLFPTSLPAGDVELLVGDTTPADGALRFRAASGRLGLQWAGGSEQLSDIQVVADTWYDLDVFWDTRQTTWVTQWRLNGVDQAEATLAGQTAGLQVAIFLGWVTAATATVRYDDWVISYLARNYPLGNWRVILLKPDPAGTLTVSGSTANFGVMSNNATIGAWNAGTAKTAISEGPPPTIGATQDGMVAVNASATDYVAVPMETYTATSDVLIRAVRLLVLGWAASGTTATARLLADLGDEVVTVLAETDPAWDNSTTAPAWLALMVKPTDRWTQARLDALTVRFGSNDATPDLGPGWLAAEVGLQTAQSVMLFGSSEDDPLNVRQDLDPFTQGIAGLVATNTSGQPATLIYELNGVEQTPVSLPDGTSGLEIPIDAPDMPTVSRVTLRPDG